MLFWKKVKFKYLPKNYWYNSGSTGILFGVLKNLLCNKKNDTLIMLELLKQENHQCFDTNQLLEQELISQVGSDADLFPKLLYNAGYLTVGPSKYFTFPNKEIKEQFNKELSKELSLSFFPELLN